MKIELLLCLVILAVAQTKTEGFKSGFPGGSKGRSKRLFLPFGRNRGDSSDEIEDSDSEHIVRISRQTNYGGTQGPRGSVLQYPKSDFLGQSLELAKSGELDTMLQNEDWQKFAHEILGLLDSTNSPEPQWNGGDDFDLVDLSTSDRKEPPLKREIHSDRYPKPLQTPPNVHIHIPVFLNGDNKSNQDFFAKGFHLYFAWEEKPKRNPTGQQEPIVNDFASGKALTPGHQQNLSANEQVRLQGLSDFSSLQADQVQGQNKYVNQNGFELFHQTESVIDTTSKSTGILNHTNPLNDGERNSTIAQSTSTLAPLQITSPIPTMKPKVIEVTTTTKSEDDQSLENLLEERKEHSDRFGLVLGGGTDNAEDNRIMKIFWSNITLDMCPTNLTFTFQNPILLSHLNDQIMVCGNSSSANSSKETGITSHSCSGFSLVSHERVSMPDPIELISPGSTHLGWQQKLYVMGGGTLENPSPMVQVYDQVEMKWFEGQALSYPRFGACSVLVDGILLILGGSGADGTSEMYDTLTGRGWAILPKMKQPRTNPGCRLVSKGVLHPDLEGVIVVGGNGGNVSSVEFLPTSRQLLTRGGLQWQLLPSLTTGEDSRHEVLLTNRTLQILTWSVSTGASLHTWDDSTWIQGSISQDATFLDEAEIELFDEGFATFEIPCL